MNMKQWYVSIDVQIPSTPDKYNEHSFTELTIQARLIQTEEEVAIKDGEKIIAKAKMFSSTALSIGTKVGGYKVISTKVCRNKQNVVQFHKYYLI